MSIDDLKSALSTADPSIDTSQLDKYVLWVFDCKTAEGLADVKELEQSKVIDRLQNGNIHRTSK